MEGRLFICPGASRPVSHKYSKVSLPSPPGHPYHTFTCPYHLPPLTWISGYYLHSAQQNSASEPRKVCRLQALPEVEEPGSVCVHTCLCAEAAVSKVVPLVSSLLGLRHIVTPDRGAQRCVSQAHV